MAFKFEKLKIWQISLDLSDKINELARQFPQYELFSLSQQIRKAADSVNLNIAEGCTAQSDNEYARFLNYSIRSAVEVVSCLFLARKKKYLNEDKFMPLYTDYEVLVKMITKLRNSLG